MPHGGEASTGSTIADSTAAGGPVKIFTGPNGWAWTVSIYGGSVQQLTYTDDATSDVCPTGRVPSRFP